MGMNFKQAKDRRNRNDWAVPGFAAIAAFLSRIRQSKLRIMRTKPKSVTKATKPQTQPAPPPPVPLRGTPKKGLPTTNEGILSAFDQLLEKGKPNAFVRCHRDGAYPSILWDVVGDTETNRLFVVATTPVRKVRFGAVAGNPGGWAIKGQIFGIDVETSAIANQLSEQLLAQHRSELLR